MVLLYGPRGRRFLMIEVPLYATHHTKPSKYLLPFPSLID